MSKATRAKKEPVNPFKLSRRIFLIVVLVILLAGVGLRFLTYKNVVTGSMVQLKGADAYYFVRQAQDIRSGGLPARDPLVCYPDGFDYDRSAALYPYLLAGMGNFMPLELATAISSPLLALLTMVVVLFLLKELFPENDYAVIGGLAVMALTGIQYISRSYFGFGDRHALEVFLLALGLLGLLKAWHVTGRKLWIWTAAAAVSFAAYNYAWSQSSMILMIIAGGIALTYLVAKNLPKNFTKINMIVFAAQLLPALLFANTQLLGITLTALVLFLIMHLLRARIPKTGARLLWAGGALVLLLASVYLFGRPFWDRIWYVINGFLGNNSAGPLVSEAQPMFAIYSSLSLLPPDAVTMQVALFVLAIIGLFFSWKRKQYLIFVLGLMLALLSIMRIRTEYYFVIFAGIGVAYLIENTRQMFWIVSGLAASFLLLYSSAWSQDLANQNSSLAFSNADYTMAVWMKQNLPDTGVALSGSYTDNVQPAYGILADWQLGYLYTYIGNKPFYAEPNFCHYLDPVKFFMMTDEAEAWSYLKANNLRYVLIKPVTLSKYYYYLTQLDQTDQFGSATGTVNNQQETFTDQKYYQRIFAKLFNFNAQGYVPDQIYTINSQKQLSTFTNFSDALKTGAGTYYSTDLNKSPIPVEPSKYFKLVHTESDNQGGVKLFEIVDQP
jgi:asparagine N-glycosylation enzyme membrane subunit Stt3